MEGFFIAQICWFGGTYAPLNWFDCNGSALSINDYTALFSLIGTTYGGDGITTFNLPDFRGRIPVGVGQGPGLNNVVLGEMSGVENVTLAPINMPAHNHAVVSAQINASTGTASSNSPVNNVFAATTTPFYKSAVGATGKLKTVTGTLNPAGSNIPFPVRMPGLGLRTIICAEGIYPSRS